MQIGTFYQELNARCAGCCKSGIHSLEKTKEVIAEYNEMQKNGIGRIHFGRVTIFFMALKIKCDCEILRNFNPFQDTTCIQNWNLVILPHDSNPVESEGKGFHFLLQDERKRPGDLRTDLVRFSEDIR